MNTYSVINYDEADKVLAEWHSLGRKSQEISAKLPEKAKAAFFEMVLHPVLAAGNVHDIVIGSAKNRLYAFQGRNSANSMADHVMDRWRFDHELTDRYHKLLGGKWDHMMDQSHFYNNYWLVYTGIDRVTLLIIRRQQPMRQLSPQLQYLQSFDRSLSGDMGVSIEGSTASVPGDDQFHSNSGSFLTFSLSNPYSNSRSIEIFAQGTNSFSFNISVDPFVRITQKYGTIAPGTNDTDVHLKISIDWDLAPVGSGSTRINITSSTDYGTQFSPPYLLLPYNNTRIPSSFTHGFVESDATISMEAEHYSRIVNSFSSPSYLIIPNYGKTLSGITLTDSNAPSLSLSTAPALQYDFYTFTSTTSSKPANISCILSQSLNTNPHLPLKYAVGLDGDRPKIIQYINERPKTDTPPEWPNGMPIGWEKTVVDAAWVSTTSFIITEGTHILKFWALEPGVVLQKIVIDLGGVRSSYLGPPESFRIG
jgi:hypothetical protein